MKSRYLSRRTSGITLIELMIVVAIVAILLGLAVPNLQSFFVTNRLASASNELAATLATARSEAIKRGTHVTMVNNAGNANWGSGWKMCADVDRNRTCAVSEEVLREGMAVSAPITINASAELSPSISFNSAGRFVGPVDPATGGTIVICYEGATRSRALLVNGIGRIRVAVDTNANGRPENDAGADITTCAP